MSQGDHTASVFLTLPHFQKLSERLTSHQGGRNTRLDNSLSRTPKLELARQRNLRQFKEKDEKETKGQQECEEKLATFRIPHILYCKSDVWLTVHRNSVWIRKTN